MDAYIIGSGMFLPDRIVTNEDLAGTLQLDPAWIYKATGIRSRRWASKGITTSYLAANALQDALEDAGLDAGELDYLLFGTMTPDRYIPGSAFAVQNRLGLREIPCLDIRATCCNLLYGLQLAKALINSGATRHVAICLAEIQSTWLNLTPEAGTISMLFGDGASALIVSSEKKPGNLKVLDVLLRSDGSFLDDLGIRCPGSEFGNTFTPVDEEGYANYAPRMIGQSVILHASRKVASACESLLERNKLTINDVRWMVPHQANANLLAKIARSLNFAVEDGVVSVLEEFGNTSSASMGIALDVLRRSRTVEAGQIILLPAFGAGFTWGAGLCHA